MSDRTTTVTVPRPALEKALRHVGAVLPRASTMPILCHIMLDAEDGALALRATNLEASITVRVPAEVAGRLRLAVPSPFADFVARASGDDVRLTVRGERLAVSCGRARVDLATLSADDFPDFAPPDAPAVPMPLAALQRILRICVQAQSTDETRYYLNGIHWAIEKGHLVTTATDGHRLVSISAPVPEGARWPAVTLPRATVGILAKLLAGGGEGEVDVAISETCAAITTPAGMMVTKLVDGNYPDWRRIIPPRSGKTIEVDAGDLAAAVAQTSAVARNDARRVVSAGPDGLMLRSAMVDGTASAEAECEATVTGDVPRFAVNGSYLAEMASALGGTITIDMDHPGSPMLVTTDADEDVTAVIMPMKV